MSIPLLKGLILNMIERSRGFDKKVAKKIIFLLSGLAVLFIVYNLVSEIVNTFKSEGRLSEALEELHALELESKQLKERLKEVKSSDFIEKEARDKLGLSKPGETLVIIPDDKIDELLRLNRKDEETKLPNWQGWLKVFIK